MLGPIICDMEEKAPQWIACNRILPLLKEVFASDTNREKIAENRFDFVQSKETYRRCVTAAEARFKWRRLPL